MKRLFTLLAGLTLGEWSLLAATVISPIMAYYTVKSDITIVTSAAASIKVDLDKHAAEDIRKEDKRDKQFDLILLKLEHTNNRLDRVADKFNEARK